MKITMTRNTDILPLIRNWYTEGDRLYVSYFGSLFLNVSIFFLGRMEMYFVAFLKTGPLEL